MATAATRPSKSQSGFSIAVGCPGCGGELEMGEDFFVLTCRYCNSLLRIEPPEQPPAYLVRGKVPQREVRFAIDRHLRELGQPLTGSGIRYKRIYYPYWKVDAILLKVRNRIETVEEVDEEGNSRGEWDKRHTDIQLTPYSVTFPAGASLAGVPHSLGMRAGYIKMEPFAEEELQEEYSPLAVISDWAAARKHAIESVQNVGRMNVADFGKNRTEMFRPRGSIIYFPYYIAESYDDHGFRRWVADGVTGRVAGSADQLEPGTSPEAAAIEFGQLKVDFHRCGNCGHDLPEERSYMYICRHCEQLTVIEQHPLLSHDLTVTEDSGGAEDRLLPFWAFTVGPEFGAGIRAMTGGLGQSERLVVPAFAINNFEGAYRLSRRVTTAVGKMPTGPLTTPDARYVPVGVSPSEALVLARTVVAREMMGLSTSLDAPHVADGFGKLALVYIPFHKEHYFYVDSILEAVSVEKNLIPG